MTAYTVILLIPLVFTQPSSKDISNYVQNNKNEVLKEIQVFLKDSIYPVDIISDDLSLYHDYDTLELGRYDMEEIIITNQPKFIDYKLKPKYKKQYSSCNAFIKGVMIHEILHAYIQQVIIELQDSNIYVYPEYLNFTTFRPKNNSDFIEEGICEYVVNQMRENIVDNTYTPTQADLVDKTKQYWVKYVYSSTYVGKILKQDIKKGIKTLLTSKPPSTTELLCPQLYYNRIMDK